MCWHKHTAVSRDRKRVIAYYNKYWVLPLSVLRSFSLLRVMRVQRHKANRRTLEFYRLVFGVRAPFRVLLDGNFLAAAVKIKMEWARLLPKLLGVPPHLVHLHVTQCVMAELAALGEPAAAALAEARALPLLTCRAKHGHGAECSPAECAARLVGRDNAGKWLVATQDAALRDALRAVPGVPLALISTNVLILEQPAPASRAASAHAERGKAALSAEEAAAVKAALRDGRAGSSGVGGVGGGGRASGSSGGASGSGGAPKRRRPAGPSQPNPLSVKRAKKKPAPAQKPEGAVATATVAAEGGEGGGGGGGNRRKKAKRTEDE